MSALERIGVVGVGRMGEPIARAVARAGFEVRVFDSNTDALERARSAGLEPARSLAELAGFADAVVTSLPNGTIVHAVTGVDARGGDTLLAGRGRGLLLIDMSSCSPHETIKLSTALREHGAWVVDAPVSGGVARAETADLTVMVGGEPALVERCEPVLRAVARRVFRTGPVGSGHAMKALNNLLSAAGLAVTIEALLLGKAIGLDPRVMLDVLNESTGKTYASEHKIARHVLSREFDAGFGLQLMVKDLEHAAEIASRAAAEPAISLATIDVWRAAARELDGAADHTAIAMWIEKRLGGRLDG